MKARHFRFCVCGLISLAILHGASTPKPVNLKGSVDQFLVNWRKYSSSLEMKWYFTKDMVDLHNPAEALIDPKYYQQSMHPFTSTPVLGTFTVDYRFRPIPNVNFIFFMDAKPDTSDNFLTYGLNRHGYLDGQFEINVDTSSFINFSARLTLRDERLRLNQADGDHLSMPLTNSAVDDLLKMKGDYVYTKEKFELKISSLKTLLIQPRLSLAFEMTEYTYGNRAAAGGSGVDPNLISSTGFNKIGKRFYPYMDGGVIFRLANYRLNIDLWGYYHPNNLSISAGNLQSYLQWATAMDITFLASKHLTLLAGLRLTQDEYSYDPPWQTTYFNASDADLTSASKSSLNIDQRDQMVLKTYIGFRFR